jgi:glycine betaine/choline ABC-type transport system substrate-binding protein
LIISGQAGIGAFRRTEYAGGAALVELADPEQMCSHDLLVLLANSVFLDQRPDLALAMNAVIQAITNADLISLEQQMTQGGQAVDVAKAWLTSKGLG